MFKLAIFSDVHANLEALSVVVDRIKEESPDITVFLGDVVGYGPNPRDCINIVESICDIQVVGNHDYALFKKDFSSFNPLARITLEWTLKQLNEDERNRLGAHPLFSIFPLFITEGNTMFVHGSPREPLRDYVNPDLPSWSYHMFFEITREFTDVSFLFLGHTHKVTYIKVEDKYLFNPGSVGQPRDGDPRASFLIFELNEKARKFRYNFVRLDYDIETTCKKIEEFNLHPFLCHRLRRGK